MEPRGVLRKKGSCVSYRYSRNLMISRAFLSCLLMSLERETSVMRRTPGDVGNDRHAEVQHPWSDYSHNRSSPSSRIIQLNKSIIRWSVESRPGGTTTRMSVILYVEMYRGHRIGKIGLFGNLAVTCGWPYYHQPRSRTIRSTSKGMRWLPEEREDIKIEGKILDMYQHNHLIVSQ